MLLGSRWPLLNLRCEIKWPIGRSFEQLKANSALEQLQGSVV
jgi:hypothetical protein